jgi:hypothetical protein
MSLRSEGGTIAVVLKTLTPNFKRYEVRIEGGDWKSSAEKFDWSVHTGSNRLEVRAVNQFGVTGPISAAEIEVRR